MSTIHLLLAWVSVATTALLATEATWRAVRDAPRSTFSSWLSIAQLAAVAITSAVGLGLVAFGEQPDQAIHYLLAVVALVLVPGASMFVAKAQPRIRAAATAVMAVLALGAVALLFLTG